MEPVDIPPRAILTRPNIRQVKLVAPEGNDKIKGLETCGTLNVLVEPIDDDHDMPRFHSWWMPSQEDLDALNLGQPVRLTLFGDGVPPLDLGVGY